MKEYTTVIVGISIFVIIGIALIIVKSVPHTRPENNNGREMIDSGKITESQFQELDLQFSIWDGRHVGLVKDIKSRMHDPGSFEHVKTYYVIDSSGYDMIVFMDYRGKNAYGALRLSTIEARIDFLGNIWDISDE